MIMKKRSTVKSVLGLIAGYGLLLTFLFPLGFFFLLRRMRRECGKGGLTVRFVLAGGCILLVFALLCFSDLIRSGIDPMGHFTETAAVGLGAGILGGSFLSAGLFYLHKERTIRRYRALFCDRPSCDADEAAGIMKADRMQVFTDITLLSAEGFLEDIFISYEKNRIMKRESEEASVRYCSTCGRAVVLDSSRITVCPDCGGVPVMRTPPEPEPEAARPAASRIRNILWVTSAILSAVGGYFLWPLCLVLAAAACMMEWRQARPDYSLIRNCGTGILLYDLILLFYPGIFFIGDTLPDRGSVQLLNFLLLCLLSVPCYYILSAVFRQRAGHILMCREAERDLHPETVDDICRYTGLRKREADSIRKILYRLGAQSEQPDFGNR